MSPKKAHERSTNWVFWKKKAKRPNLGQKKVQVWPFKAQFGSIFIAKIQFFLCRFLRTRSEKRLLIIRNLQSEKPIVNNQKEFYLSKGKFLQIRKKIPADKKIFPLQKEFSFWQVKLFLFIDKCLLTLLIPDYQQAFFWAWKFLLGLLPNFHAFKDIWSNLPKKIWLEFPKKTTSKVSNLLTLWNFLCHVINSSLDISSIKTW